METAHVRVAAPTAGAAYGRDDLRVSWPGHPGSK